MAIKFDELLEALDLDEDNKNSNKTIYWLPKNVIKDLRSEDNWKKNRAPAKLKRGSFSYLHDDGSEYEFELDKEYGDDCYILNGFELSFTWKRKGIRAKALKIGENKNEDEIFLVFFIKDSDDDFFGWPRDICEILVNKYYNSSKKYEGSAVKDDFEVALDIINKKPELAKDYVEKILFDNGYFEDSDDYNLAMEDPIDTIQLYIKDGSFDAEEFLDFCNDAYELNGSIDESLNESLDATNQDIKLINKELERNNREVSKIGFKTHPLFDSSQISIYVPDKTYINAVKSIVDNAAKLNGCTSVVENESADGDILFSFYKDSSSSNINREESEEVKQWFENTIRKYNIDYDTALAFILDKIDKDELEFITKELIKLNNK